MQLAKIRQSIVMLASTLFVLFACLGQSFAGTLNAPRGLALDSKGNLYIANQNDNQVLVYNSNYAKKATITSGVSLPVGVALDSKSNLYVANKGSQMVTQYSSTYAQNTGFFITAGINNPWGITIDSLDDLYVSNNFVNITMYLLQASSTNPPLFQTITPSAPAVYAITTQGPFLYFGSTTFFGQGFIVELAAQQGFSGSATADNAYAMTTDKNGIMYVGNSSGEVFSFLAGAEKFVLQANFTPEGIAVDDARGRVYLSNETGNQVLVYSLTTGALLHTIE